MFEAARSDFLQALHVVDTRNLPHSIDNPLKMLEVGDLKHYIDVGLAVFGAC